MAITSGLFNSINGDRRYDAKWFARYFATFIGNGVLPNPSTGLQVVENENMTTVMKPGDGWINGYFIVNDSDYVLQHDNADGVLKRIDRIVARWDASLRDIIIVVKKGTFASNPVAPSLQRDADAHELALADVLISPGATQITQANITDTRLNKELCGIVHGLVDQVDTTTLFNQYQSWLERQKGIYEDDLSNWTDEKKSEFEAWVDSIQNILDGNVAGNLLLLIERNEADIKSLIKVKTDITISASGWTLDSSTDLFKYEIADADIDSDSMVDVNVQLEYLDFANSVKSANTSENGKVILYSTDLLDNDLVVDYRITRQVF